MDKELSYVVYPPGVVDDEGIIRLLDHIDLKEGTHVLVSVADPDTLVALFKPTYPSRTPEEPMREEIEEDAAWAYLL